MEPPGTQNQKGPVFLDSLFMVDSRLRLGCGFADRWPSFVRLIPGVLAEILYWWYSLQNS